MRRIARALTLAVVGLVPAACSGPTVQDLEVGDCLSQADLDGEEVREVAPVDCAESHSVEVFAALSLEDGDYPGREELSADAEEDCVAEFEDFVGVPFGASELGLSYLVPSAEGWEAGDRTTLCLVLAEDEVTGTLEDAGR